MSSANTSSMRASIIGSISPMWPMMSLSRGCRSSAPASTMRSTWIAVSECQPQPAGLEHAACARRQIGEVGLPHGLRREVRVDVDRHVEVHRRRQQAVIARVIEKAALGRAVDERTDEAQAPSPRASSSATAASGLCIGSTAKPAKRSGWRAMAAARWSFISRAMATPSGPGTRSGPGPVLESTCTVMPASSMDCRRRSPISGSASSGFGAVAGARSRPEAATADAAGSMRRTRAGTVKCSSSATTRMVRWPFIAIALEIAEDVRARRDLLC